ncbi:MAG: BT4734/BF3469 family protein [Saprospiraceae bacterium]
MNNISVFKNFTKEIGCRTLSQIVLGVRGTHYKEAVFQIRKAIEQGDKEAADKLKKGLLAFTVSGAFSGGRRMEFLQVYNPFVILDIDKLEVDSVNTLLDKINKIVFTRASFISPSGRGIKIIVAVNSEQEEHWLAYKKVVDFYEKKLDVEIDKSGKDITRLCFMSHDPSAYFDPESEVFNVENKEIINQSNNSINNLKNTTEKINIPDGFENAFAECISLTDEKLVFKTGSRNNYIYQLGVNCNLAGIPFEVANIMSQTTIDLSNEEIDRTVKSAYNWKPRVVKMLPTELPTDTPPPVPSGVFSKLPGFLNKGCATFKDERERDVFLTGALGVLSGCLPNVSGKYDGNKCFPNLYVFVIAPSASGKGALKFAKMLGMGYHEALLEENRKAQKKYKKELLEFELSSAKYKKGKLSELPKEPEEVVFKTLFIPANSSSAMLVRHLHYNNDSGVLFESEADTLGNVFFTANNIGIKVDGAGAAIYENLICENTSLSVQLTTNDPVDLNNNCWCTGDLNAIALVVEDAYDDPSLGIATYNIINTDCISTNLVYPGDADNNGSTNAWDLLQIGLAFDLTGAARADASDFWIGQESEDWAITFSNNVNAKHADCNGDGLVDEDDLLIVESNYNNTHSGNTTYEPAIDATTNATLAMNVIGGLTANGLLQIDFSLADANNPMSDLYGIAFSLAGNESFFSANTTQLNTVDSWLGNNDNMLTMMQSFPDDGRMDIAMVKNDQEPTAGGGNLASLFFQVPSDFNASGLSLSLENVVALTSDGTQISIDHSPLTIETSSVDDVLTSFSFYPNPVSELLTLDAQNLELKSVDILDVNGRIINSYETERTDFDVSQLTKGIYFLRLLTAEGVGVKRFVKQ